MVLYAAAKHETQNWKLLYYKFVNRSLALGLLLLALLAGCYRGSRPAGVGLAAPDFSVQDSERTVALHELRGKVVVLNFWATWCAPCVEEMPSMVQMQQKLKDKGITVLAVSVDVDQKAYERFLREHRVDLLTVRDPDQKSNLLYGTTQFPETYVIDRQGVIRRKFIGAVDWNAPEIVAYLSNL